MTIPEDTFIDLHKLYVGAHEAEIVAWQGRQALRLEGSLALIPNLCLESASVEVRIGVDGPAYPGVAFRLQDTLNFELAYAVPHVSGQWDAIQYDPVFHGSNTWQIFHGPAYQRAAQAPSGDWFQLSVDFCGSRAAIRVNNQPPLVIERLARQGEAGFLDLWTYRPAYFCDLRVGPCQAINLPPGESPTEAKGALGVWFLEDYGAVACEPNGILNLNRYLPATLGQARLSRRFEVSRSGEVVFEFGFSDQLSLELDGEEIFNGEHTFQGFADRAARGYVEPGMVSIAQEMNAGAHHLAATLKLSEPFGWGLALAAHAEGLRWLPAGVADREIENQEAVEDP